MDEQQRKMIGKNLATARKLAGLTQIEVMGEVWNRTSNKNRISELENGAVPISVELLIKLCLLYGVSADYILGFSVEPELDLNAGRAGHIYSHMKSLVEDMTKALCITAAQNMAAMPKPHAEAMADQARHTCQEAAKVLHLLPESCQHLRAAILAQVEALRTFDRAVALQMRSMENAVTGIMDRDDLEDGHQMLADLGNGRIKKIMLTKTESPLCPANDDQGHLTLLPSGGHEDQLQLPGMVG